MSTDYPNAWGGYPCDDNTPDMCDYIIAEATAEVISDLEDLMESKATLSEYALESVQCNIPHQWEDILEAKDLAERVELEVLDQIKWARINGHI